MKNTNGGVLLLVKLLTTGFQPATLLKLTLLQGCFSRFFKIVQMVPNRAKTSHISCQKDVFGEPAFKYGNDKNFDFTRLRKNFNLLMWRAKDMFR